jgi:carbonic anhydrase
VRWLVMKTPIEASAAQIKAFTDTMGSHTNRPIQALNGRVILE